MIVFEIAYARYLFRDKENNYTPNVEGPPKPLEISKTKWRSPKPNCPELETFLTLAEKDLFQNTTVDNVKDNLTPMERRA